MIKEVGSNIWQITGAIDGPSVVILGGVHGDEKTGIEVIKFLREVCQPPTKKLLKGKLILALGNERAVEAGVREIDGHNLNRLFNVEYLSKPAEDFYESRRAHELAGFLRQADYLLDLHATFSPSRPFLAGAATPRHEKIYRWFNTDLVLTDPNFVVGDGQATTDEFVDVCGGVGICFEAGWLGDTSLVPVVSESVLKILVDLGMIAAEAETPVPPKPTYQIFELTKKIVLTLDGFSYAQGIGLESFFPVKSSQVIGYHGKREELVAEDGVLVFQKDKALWQVNQPICFFAKKV
ncbi:MAG: hypothetical protein UW63_C0078G0006 [Candidatus Uhrbacteria bacterium GW2011_GWF2_44_350]|uniref:Succinylglutamate desuccinylase/Aspartoacylase catalytic domain-containing protein n=1 Tax=Candidatus Uhrbacteria bacterium GW2011_GWF2_44_350 TaxID=1619000 RepID=A0A0G1JAU2_9BACT|nr:MAG: hypothetical protein UW63_C0078G0006 [Candidatus Uhrbacteria bacterium GW2011_GWF2_44_350]HBR80143.1 hypothetical protein [Candidatus Uhrbacteria bacterium]HCU31332.1 hypothetical protein [Candidatus Uhrbacteria bacterium]